MLMLMMLMLMLLLLLPPLPMQLFCEGSRSSLQPCLHAQQRRRYVEWEQTPHQKQEKKQQRRRNCDGDSSLSTATADV